MKYKEGTNEYWVLARLAEESEYMSEPKSHQMVYFTNGSIICHARRISNLPKEYPDTRFYSANMDYLKGIDHTFTMKNEVEAQREIEKELKGKVLLFFPYFSKGHDNMDWSAGIQVLSAPEGFSNASRYRVLPLLSAKDGLTEEDLQDGLLTPNTYLHIQRSLSRTKDDMPPFILWKRHSGDIVLYGPVTDMRYTPSGGYGYSANPLKRILLSDTILRKSIPTSKGIIFLPEDEMDRLLVALASAPDETVTSIAPESGIKEDKSQETIEQPSKAEIKGIDPFPDSPLGEADFLKCFFSHVHQSGYVYTEKDLVNFHVAMKSSTLVILSGMSGTGKSKIVSLYGESLGLPSEEIRMIPVRPSWTDDTDILGYLDTTTMLYRAADTGLVDTLRAASENPNKLYLICFDEMNLARVEHYFSQFLSVLENPVGKRFLQLYNPELEARVYNASEYPSRIELGKNLLFVGTVNLDESTFHFSDKVLDRANVIRFHRCSFAELKKCSLEAPPKQETLPTVSTTTYLSFENPEKRAISLTDQEIAFLTDLDALLDETKTDGGIGFRILRQIDDYLKNVPAGAVLTHQEAFDLQIAQRVLTKLRGSREQLQDLLDSSRKDNGKYLPDLLDQYKDLSDFTDCRAILTHKGSELIEYGYIL
jgi:hypothetical protein